METVNIYEAKTRLSQLVDKAASGEDVVVSRNGKPLVRITQLREPKRRIKFGLLKGKLTVPAAPMEVTLNTDLTLTLLDRQAATPPVKVSLDELVARIKAKQSRFPDQPVVIGAAASTRYDEVIKVLDRLQTGGVHKVGLLARPAGGS